VSDIKDLSDEIAKRLKQYTKEVTEEIKIAQVDVAKDLKNTLEIKSPERLGSYKKGWRIKKVKNALVIHNKTDYQLTHLLEHGHVTRDGSTRTKEKPHIRPAEEVAIRDYLDRIEEAIKK
jgi:hypothetical protein